MTQRSWSREVVAVPGCGLSVLVRRAADPAVLILHGQFGVASLFQSVYGRELTAQTVAIPDLRGRGQSVCSDESSYSWARLVDDVIALLDHLGASSAVLAGSSMGAGLAVATALRHPQRVDALVLWPMPYAGSRIGWIGGQQAAMHAVLDFARDVRERSLEEAIATYCERDPTVDAVGLRARWARHDPSSLAAALLGLGWSQPFDYLDDLGAIAVPTAVAPGGDELHPRHVGERYLEVITNAEGITDAPADFFRFVAGLTR